MRALEFKTHLTSAESIQMPSDALEQIPRGSAIRVILLFDFDLNDEIARAAMTGEGPQFPANEMPDLGVAEEIVSVPGEQFSGGLAPNAAVDQCPPVSISEEKLRQMATRLRGVYWDSFKRLKAADRRIEALMGWIRFRCRCVYCCKDMADPNHMLGLGTTDHLLPKADYSELDFLRKELPRNYLNAVPCCFSCNRIKRDWDPNKPDKAEVGPEQAEKLYEKDDVAKQLTPDVQLKLIERARKYIGKQRRRLLDGYGTDCENWRDIEREIDADDSEQHSDACNGEHPRRD